MAQTSQPFCRNCGAALAPNMKFCGQCGAPTPGESAGRPFGVGEAIFSIAIGLFLAFIQPRMFQWVFSRLFGTHFNEFTSTATGKVVPYPQLPEFWMDLGPAAFAVAMILTGLVLLITGSRVVVLLALALLAAATLYNLGYVIATLSKGFAPISALCAIGGIVLLVSARPALRRG